VEGHDSGRFPLFVRKVCACIEYAFQRKVNCFSDIFQILSLIIFCSVKTRMASSSGISFSEFSYQLLQAQDFWHLYKHHNCRIQIGGSDQWGNIVSGLDLIVRREPESVSSPDGKAFGLTTPILTTASGQKFGKSAGNAIWLDRTKTSVFDFYQVSRATFLPR